MKVESQLNGSEGGGRVGISEKNNQQIYMTSSLLELLP